MCGIFGSIFERKQADAEEATQRAVLLTALAASMEDRGSQSWGLFAPLAGPGGTLHKSLGGITGTSMIPYSRLRTVFAHTRFATAGAVTRENSHPFRHGRIVAAHNGVVYNHAELNRRHGRKFEVDSMHFPANLDLGVSLAEIEAYGTVVWHDDDRPGKLHLGRFQGGELCVAKTARGLVFASTERAVKAACHAAQVEIREIVPTTEGTAYEATHAGLTIVDQRFAAIKRTSTRGWESGYSGSFAGFGDTWRKSLDEWEAGNRRSTPVTATAAPRNALTNTTRPATWTPPSASPPSTRRTGRMSLASGGGGPVVVPARVSDDNDDPTRGRDATAIDRRVIEALAHQHGATRNDARRAWDRGFDPTDRFDELYKAAGKANEELYREVMDIIDMDAWVDALCAPVWGAE